MTTNNYDMPLNCLPEGMQVLNQAIPIVPRVNMDFNVSMSFPPDTDPWYILQEIARQTNENNLVLVKLYRMGENRATFADFKFI